MPASWNRNRLTAKLGIDYPIVQGPFGGLASQRLTAAVSKFGGLGSFGAHGLAPEAIKDVIAEIRSLTSKPFATNLWVSMEDEGARTSDEGAFNRSLEPLAIHLDALGVPHPAYKPYTPARFEDQARVLLDANVPVFSFIFGIPPKEILEECRAKRIVTIGATTTPDEGAALQEGGVDTIAASGFEAGGHRGSFLRAAEDSLTGTLSLVPQIVDTDEVHEGIVSLSIDELSPTSRNRNQSVCFAVKWAMARNSPPEIRVTDPSEIQPGDIVTRGKKTWVGEHYGTALDGGMVAHTVPGRGKHVSTLAEFAGGKRLKYKRPVRTPEEIARVQQRAVADLGKPYVPAVSNCEHDVTTVHSGRGYSYRVGQLVPETFPR